MADNNNTNAGDQQGGGEQNQPQANQQQQNNQPQGGEQSNVQPQGGEQQGEQQPQAQTQQPAAPQQPAQPEPAQQPAPAQSQQPVPTPSNIAEQIVNFGKQQPGFELPQGVSDRTKEQFDKLTENNKKLLESNQQLQSELNQRLQSEQRLQPLQNLAQPQQPDITEFVVEETDPVTGQKYRAIDEDKLQKAISSANDRAVRAEQQVQNYIQRQQQSEDARQAAETFKAYPNLNPDSPNFDSELNKVTRRIALDSMMNPQDYGGHPLNFKEAADLAAEELGGDKEDEKQQSDQAPANQQQMQQQNDNNQQQPNTTSVKEQGGLSAQGQPGGQPPQDDAEDLEELRQLTRRGGDRGMWAIAQRLQNVPHVGTPTSNSEIGEE